MHGMLNQISVWARPLYEEQRDIVMRGFDMQAFNPRTGLLAYYTMEEGRGSQAKEITGQNPSAVILGASWNRDTPEMGSFR